MQAIELRNLTDSVAHAVSREKTRLPLIYTYLVPEDGGLTAIATDGHRLAHAHSSVGIDGLTFPLLADPKGLASLPKVGRKGGWSQLQLANGVPGVYRIGIGASCPVVEATAFREGVHIDSMGMELEFPSWKAILPAERKPSLALTVTDDTLDTLDVMARISPWVRISLTPDGRLLAEQRAKACDYTATLAIGKAELLEGFDGFKPFGMNASYLADALRFARGGSYVQIQVQPDLKPIIFGDSTDFELVMPARL